jgi:hypothetical protein
MGQAASSNGAYQAQENVQSGGQGQAPVRPQQQQFRPPQTLDNGIRVVCPHCGAHLIPPAPLFRCPCGQMMTIAAQLVPAMPHGGLRPAGWPGGPPPPRAAELDARIRAALARLPPTDPQAIFLITLLNRIPRTPDGTMDPRAFEEISKALENALKGASQQMLDYLPTRLFHPSQLPQKADEEHTSCRVCLSAYEDGETLRTLPCLHSFHQACIDPWLRGRKDCPLCKVSALRLQSHPHAHTTPLPIEQLPVDTDVIAHMAREEERARAKGEAAGGRARAPAAGKNVWTGGATQAEAESERERGAPAPAQEALPQPAAPAPTAAGGGGPRLLPPPRSHFPPTQTGDGGGGVEGEARPTLLGLRTRAAEL